MSSLKHQEKKYRLTWSYCKAFTGSQKFFSGVVFPGYWVFAEIPAGLTPFPHPRTPLCYFPFPLTQLQPHLIFPSFLADNYSIHSTMTSGFFSLVMTVVVYIVGYFMKKVNMDGVCVFIDLCIFYKDLLLLCYVVNGSSCPHVSYLSAYLV